MFGNSLKMYDHLPKRCSLSRQVVFHGMVSQDRHYSILNEFGGKTFISRGRFEVIISSNVQL